MASGNSMKLSTIPITLRNGRVRAEAVKYDRTCQTCGAAIYQGVLCASCWVKCFEKSYGRVTAKGGSK